MSTQDRTTDYLYSTLGGDPDLGEIVDEFVAEMPDRVEKLQRLAAAADWESLRRTAHQFKGAAGSYGFDVLTTSAAQLEAAAAAPTEGDILKQVNELAALCRRARGGVPE